MCGIAAIAGRDLRDDALAPALEALGKRGPDDRGTMHFPRAALAHTRLSIIDLSPMGHQPMRDEARGTAVTFNGEIYNYQALRRELETLGQRFATHSDTEVILKAYAQWGDACVARLDGMFAFALWDEAKERLLLARDRFGKKPLYYAIKDGALYAASELKALKALGVVGALNPAALDDYLALGYIPPWESAWSGVKTLLPAHYGVFESGRLTAERYWALERRPLAISYGDAKEEVRRLLTEAVKKRMLAADVEVGSFLSGGVDSTLVTAYAQPFVSHPIKTFSVGYGEYINELPYAEEASKKIGTDHDTLRAQGDLVEELERVMAYFDEPHADTSNFPQHLVSELAARKVKVALSGDGGDELFMGYGWYWKWWHLPKLTKLTESLTSSQFAHYLREVTLFDERARAGLWQQAPAHEARLDRLAQAGAGTTRINLFDLTTYLPGQLLTKVDRASMMHGLEVRSPLLDTALAEFVYNLPDEYKFDRRGGRGKLILKDLLGELMPPAFVERRKQGFGAPVREWLGEPRMRAYLEAQLGPWARLYEYLREPAVRAFMDRTLRGGSRQDHYRLWSLLALEVWLKRHA